MSSQLTLWSLVAVSILTFLLDLATPVGVVSGIPYVIVVVGSLWGSQHRFLLLLATICTGLIVLGFFFSPPGSLIWHSLVNRAASVLVIWVIALFGWQRKKMEVALEQARDAAEAASRSKSEFLASMAHELRTPLNAIIGYSELLLEGAFGALTAEEVRPLERVQKNAHELSDLISTVLDLSRLDAGRLPVDLKTVRVPVFIADIIEEIQESGEQSKLQFKGIVDETLPPLYTDPGKLKVVLKNLLGNAVKFTPTGSITVMATNRNGGVEISVTDTGIGIPAEAFPLIFEPFQQVENASRGRQDGSGLGLYIVKRLLHLLNGTIAVESEIGQGSTFRMWLPAGKIEDGQ